MQIMPTTEYRCCPTCAQTVRLYRRTLNHTMVRQLAVLAKYGPLSSAEWNRYNVDAGVAQAGVGDMSKLRYWGLVEKDGKHKNDKWRACARAFEFLTGAESVPRVAYVYNREVRSMSADLVSVSQVDPAFNFAAL